ncbi:hypothetical protein FT663_03846 [Candidozyma haemuli var. vulneris]|nr:hypothetical protein FT662_03208 [[Candida] haemuloni var. vulneris]KAF3988873.1 hypothetical protein FT663_03846 [[Candida] haemuloni var. vulneris]
MSTSKVTTPSASKSSNSGNTKEGGSSAPRQSRFRGDVPAFNPTGQSPFVLAQQFQNPPFPQQPQPYQHPQMMYGGQVPGGYMQYMGYPEYMMGYPYFTMPSAPFPQPYMAPHMNNMNNYMPPNSKQKKFSKGHNAYNNTNSHNNHQSHFNEGAHGEPYGPPPHAKFNQSYSSRSESPSTVPYTSQQTPESSNATTLPEETPPTTQQDIDREAKDSPEPVAPASQPVAETPVAATEEDQEVQVAPEEPKAAPEEQPKLGSLPLLFSTSLDEYSTSRSQDASNKQKLLASKHSRVQKYVQSQKTSSGAIANPIINKNGTRNVVDHSSGKTVNELIYPAEKSTSDASNASNDPNAPNDNDSNDNTSTTRPSNWAAILQTTATKKAPKKTTATSKSSQAPIESKSASPAPASITDGPQSLGLLSLKMLFDPEFSFSSLPSYSINPRGLTNTGNICYMNAVLQCLMFCEPFNKLIRHVDEKAVGTLDKKSSQPIVDATIHFIKDFLKVAAPNGANGSNGTLNSQGIVVGRPLSPEVLYQRLVENTKFRHLKWGQQEDAEEFLTYFLDGLHEDFVKAEADVASAQIDELVSLCQSKFNDSTSKQNVKSKIKTAYRVTKQLVNQGEEVEASDEEEEANGWSEVGSGKRVSKKRVVDVEPSPITSIFGGRFRSVLTIPKGKESQSITVDPFRCMSVDISQKDVSTIEDALWSSHQIEKIPFKIDAEREVTAKKQTFIDQLPEVLLLQLKRFAYQQEPESQNFSREGSTEPNGKDAVSYGTIEKVMKDVKFGLDLEIPPECLSTTLRAADPKPTYKLVGVIYHHGRNAEGGHYTCDVFRNGMAESSSVGDKKWLRIDDTSVEAISSDAVVETPEANDKSAYILMYQRI